MGKEVPARVIKVRPIFKSGPEIGPVDISNATKGEQRLLVAHYQGIVAMTGSTIAQEQLAKLQSIPETEHRTI